MKLFILALPLFLAACAPQMGSVIPKKDNTYEVAAIGYTEKGALDSALHTAEQTCKQRNMRHIVNQSNTEYVGRYKSPAAAEKVNQSNQATAAVLKIAPPPRVNRNDDARAVVDFSCVPN